MSNNKLQAGLVYRLTLEDDLVVNFVPTGFKNEWFVFEDSPYNVHLPLEKVCKYMTIEDIKKQYQITLPNSTPIVSKMLKENPNDADLGSVLRTFAIITQQL
tara:strand:+ start:263 stop:568 length:306 start_codon:yes stop_codon:yes gene_type:complete